jgi:hypothetical protein
MCLNPSIIVYDSKVSNLPRKFAFGHIGHSWIKSVVRMVMYDNSIMAFLTKFN